MIKTNDELDAKKWRMLWSVFEQMGIYPAKIGDKERTVYQDGWNDCQEQLLVCIELMEKFYDNIDPSLPDKIQKLNDDEFLWFGLNKKDFWSDIKMFVVCNDLFWWAVADLEDVTLEEIPALYDACYDENGEIKKWGSDIWCCLHRGMRPQHPIEDKMKEEGFWTDELDALPVRGDTG